MVTPGEKTQRMQTTGYGALNAMGAFADPEGAAIVHSFPPESLTRPLFLFFKAGIQDQKYHLTHGEEGEGSPQGHTAPNPMVTQVWVRWPGALLLGKCPRPYPQMYPPFTKHQRRPGHWQSAQHNTKSATSRRRTNVTPIVRHLKRCPHKCDDFMGG